jgi:hypothetical protein
MHLTAIRGLWTGCLIAMRVVTAYADETAEVL